MSFIVRKLPLAEQDALDAAIWYEERRPGLGEEFLNEVDRAVPGDIAAVAKVDEIGFDCVLHDSHDEDQICMRPLEFPTPMHGFAISPKKRGDEQRISDVLHKMIAEDPTLTLEHDPNLNETVLRGLGELHLRSVFERMASQFKLEIDTRPPRIRCESPRTSRRCGR